MKFAGTNFLMREVSRYVPRPFSSHHFLVGEAEDMWLYPVARTNVFSATKHVFCNLSTSSHKILEFVPSCPICGRLAW